MKIVTTMCPSVSELLKDNLRMSTSSSLFSTEL